MEDTLYSIGGRSAGFPNAPAILGFPTSLLAGGGEVFGGNFTGFLGLGVFYFVEVQHLSHFLSFLYLNYNIDCFICQALFLKFFYPKQYFLPVSIHKAAYFFEYKNEKRSGSGTRLF